MLYSIEPLGDNAVTLTFGHQMVNAINEQVIAFAEQLNSLQIIGVIDVVPAYASVTVFYDVVTVLQATRAKSAFGYIVHQIKQLHVYSAVKRTAQKVLQVPVCYSNEFGIDIADMCTATGLSVKTFIQLHCSKIYCVYMIGFLPGFAYMGSVDPAIAVPRKAVPRMRVEAGSVGIAGSQTGIYPFQSPGGWQIIGRTPLKMFDAGRANPVYFKAGDLVKFYPITEHEFYSY